MRQTKQPKTLEQLKAHWYKRLEKDGFKDIEQADGIYLKRWSSSKIKEDYSNPDLFGAKERYYQLAGQFLHDHKFETRLHKYIWEYHSEGMSIRNIVKALEHRGLKSYRRQVNETLQKLTKQMLEQNRGGGSNE